MAEVEICLMQNDHSHSASIQSPRREVLKYPVNQFILAEDVFCSVVPNKIGIANFHGRHLGRESNHVIKSCDRNTHDWNHRTIENREGRGFQKVDGHYVTIYCSTTVLHRFCVCLQPTRSENCGTAMADASEFPANCSSFHR